MDYSKIKLQGGFQVLSPKITGGLWYRVDAVLKSFH